METKIFYFSSSKVLLPRQDFLLFRGRHLHPRVCLHSCEQVGLPAVLRFPRQETEDCESLSFFVASGNSILFLFSPDPFYFSKIKFLINVWSQARPDMSATSCFRLKPPHSPSPRPSIWHSTGGNREPSLPPIITVYYYTLGSMGSWVDILTFPK